MSAFLLIGLLAIAYFLFVSGLEFLGLLALVIAALFFLTGSFQSQAAGPSNMKITEPFGPQGPIVVENKMPDIPPRINFKVKPNYHEYMGFEYAMFNWGTAWHNLGMFFYNLLSGSKTNKPEDDDHGGGH